MDAQRDEVNRSNESPAALIAELVISARRLHAPPSLVQSDGEAPSDRLVVEEFNAIMQRLIESEGRTLEEICALLWVADRCFCHVNAAQLAGRAVDWHLHSFGLEMLRRATDFVQAMRASNAERWRQ